MHKSPFSVTRDSSYSSHGLAIQIGTVDAGPPRASQPAVGHRLRDLVAADDREHLHQPISKPL